VQRRIGASAPLLAIVAIGMAFTLLRQLSGHGDYLVDLRAFYCGGSSLLHHQDPYTTQNVACSHAINASAEVLRAPHPPFALVIYALLALAPFKAVSFAYIVLAWCAVGATSFVLSKITRIESWVAALGTAPFLGYHCISFGQPTPFIALFIVLAAYHLMRGRYVAAALAAAFTLIFPQVGLPIVVALFVCVPGTRVALVGFVALLALVGLAALGPQANIHYVSVSLKLEQLQTAGDALQCGLPWLLQQLGVAPFAAALAGSIWYVVVIAGGIAWLARNVTDSTRALVAVVPPALVPLCSSFVHPQHFALALCAALVILGSQPRRLGPVLFGTTLLTVPWFNCIVARAVLHEGARAAIFACIAVGFAACFVRFDVDAPMRPRLRNWIVAIAACVAAVIGLIHLTLGTIPIVDTPPSTLNTLSFKLPSIAGVLIVLACGLFVPHGRREPTLRA
jgi:hypothetical protein